MKKLILLLTLTICVTENPFAQWLTNGSSVYYNNGNVGIGTAAPEWQLEVRKDQFTDTRIMVRNMASGFNVKARYELSTGTPLSYALSELHDFGGSPYYLFAVGSAVTGAYYEAPQFNFRNLAGTSFLKINGNGNIGIGTEAPGSYKLAVEGKIGAREIKVTLQNPWPDYVFEKKADLRQLADLESFIIKNKHLPGIPSAKEVKENEGIELGEMNRKLLEKIEELTQYVIELNKEIISLKAGVRH